MGDEKGVGSAKKRGVKFRFKQQRKHGGKVLSHILRTGDVLVYLSLKSVLSLMFSFSFFSNLDLRNSTRMTDGRTNARTVRTWGMQFKIETPLISLHISASL